MSLSGLCSTCTLQRVARRAEPIKNLSTCSDLGFKNLAEEGSRAQASGLHMGSCQDYGPFLGTLNIRCRIIVGAQKKDHNFDNHPYVFLPKPRDVWGLPGVMVVRALGL